LLGLLSVCWLLPRSFKTLRKSTKNHCQAFWIVLDDGFDGANESTFSGAHRAHLIGADQLQLNAFNKRFVSRAALLASIIPNRFKILRLGQWYRLRSDAITSA
jgi:hypothetical protein